MAVCCTICGKMERKEVYLPPGRVNREEIHLQTLKKYKSYAKRYF